MIRRMTPGLLAAASLLATTGCTADRFAKSAGQFGHLTRAAVAEQGQRLTAVTAAERERISADLAERRVDLRLKDCSSAAAGLAGRAAARCRFVTSAGGDIESAARFDHIAALGGALSAYSDNLILLASDAKEDRAAFASSITALGASLGGLDGAIRKAAGETGPDHSAQLNAIAGLISKAGDLYLMSRRARVLRDIILVGDPLVQRAAQILADADDQIDIYDRLAIFAALADAQKAQSGIIAHGGSTRDIRAAQDRMFAGQEKLNAYLADRERFGAVAEAHHKLALAARSGATLAELQAAIEAMIDLASTIDATAAALTDQPKGPSQ